MADPYWAPLADCPSNSTAPMFAEMKPIPVIHAGNDLPERKKSRDERTARLSANPMPRTNRK
jgi:hypothetical protein